MDQYKDIDEWSEEELENYRKRFGKRKKKELPKVVIDGKTYTDVTSLIVDCGEA